MLEVYQESITEDLIFHLHKSQNSTCQNCAQLIGDKIVTGCSFIMLSLEPNEHLGHLSGSVVLFFFNRKRKCVCAMEKRFYTRKVPLAEGLNFSLVCFPFFDFLNSELYN